MNTKGMDADCQIPGKNWYWKFEIMQFLNSKNSKYCNTDLRRPIHYWTLNMKIFETIEYENVEFVLLIVMLDYSRSFIHYYSGMVVRLSNYCLLIVL